MSHFSVALRLLCEELELSQSALARAAHVPHSTVSRVLGGQTDALSPENFLALLRVFTNARQAQARLVAARCRDVCLGPGAELVDIRVREGPGKTAEKIVARLPHKTERVFTWLREQCPLRPELEEHLVQYARLLGMPPE